MEALDAERAADEDMVGPLALVPVWIDNLTRVLPKGEFIPVPLLCTVTFGSPLRLEPGEGSMPFRERTRAALLALAPGAET